MSSYFKSKIESSFINARRILFLLTNSEKKTTIFLMFLMFIGMLLETLGVGLVVPAIAFMTQDGLDNASPFLLDIIVLLGSPSQTGLIIIGMIALISIYLLKALFLSYLIWKQTKFAFGVQASLSYRLFSVYLSQPYGFHLHRNSAQLIRNVITEVNLYTFSAILPFMMLLTELMVLLGLTILLVIVEPFGTLTLIGVIGSITYLFHFLTKKRITLWGKARQNHEGLRIQQLQQGLGGIKDVKLLRKEEYFLSEYAIHNDVSAKMGEKQKTLAQLPRVWLELIAVSGLAALVVVLLNNNQSISTIVPTIGLFAAAAFRLLPSITRILGAVQALRYGVPVIDELFNELALGLKQNIEVDQKSISFKNELTMDCVSFVYDQGVSPALSKVQLSIPRGHTVGLIGGSGAGKSTMIDLILGLLQPSEGEINIDGKALAGRLDAWQGLIGYVPQNIFLTDDSLRRNIAFGVADELIDEAKVKKSLIDAQLELFVDDLPNGLDTMVGERGVRLSGGQIQRIGICRALYLNPEILVLDEATSSLDIDTEKEVMESIQKMHGQKTIIIVAHRLSTVEHCDRIFRLEGGRVVAQGQAETMLKSAEVH